MIKKQLYTIAASQPFLEILAHNIYSRYKNKPEDLTKLVILLPTRRACRSFQEIMLQLSDGSPLILPKLYPISDIDPDELSFNLAEFDLQDLKMPIPPIKRQIYLVQLIQKQNRNMPYDQAFTLAQALSQLLDQVHTENLNLNDLKHIVDEAEFSKHWQITLDFLSIISQAWPAILEEEELIDPAAHRNQFLQKIAQYWTKNSPDYPVIFAGSTGTIPAVRGIMHSILSMPNGRVILPGLDKDMPDAQWHEIEEGHPQAALKQLIEFLDVQRQDIDYFDTQNIFPINTERELIASALNFPNDARQCDVKKLSSELNKITLYECDTIQEEALTISLIIRESLEKPDKTIALVTPNRKLAKRVQQICLRWDIQLDDTAGAGLGETNLGKYLTAVSSFINSDFDPVALLTLLKHPYIDIQISPGMISLLEILLLRGIKNYESFEDLEKKYNTLEDYIIKNNDPDKQLPEILEKLGKIFNSTLSQFSEGDISQLLRLHIGLAEHLCGNSLWEKEYAEEAADLISKIDEYSKSLPAVSGDDYHQIFSSIINTVTIRPKFGTNTRAKIYGLIEARMLHSDSVIMGGLNEGMWPDDAGHDPWVSRPMRKTYGLPSLERGITLSAHDFLMAFCQNEVFMTRCKREDGTPTVPSRWLQKLNVFLQSINLSFEQFNQGQHLNYSRLLDQANDTQPIKRPEPRPPLSARPDKLSVTRIDLWRNDPYGLYANKILNLRAIDPIKSHVDIAERGIILHEILQNFNDKFKKKLPVNPEIGFLDIAKDIILQKYKSESLWLSWKSRLIKIADEYTQFESEWREQARIFKTEEKISCFLKQCNFTLEARVDRIDMLNDGNKAIIDYKSGGYYTPAKMLNGTLSQLPLEALILQENGESTGYLGYWKITGASKAIEITALKDEEDAQKATDIVTTGLSNIVTEFSNIETPYYALPNPYTIPRFNDYSYLERVQEWTALDDEEVA